MAKLQYPAALEVCSECNETLIVSTSRLYLVCPNSHGKLKHSAILQFHSGGKFHHRWTNWGPHVPRISQTMQKHGRFTVWICGVKLYRRRGRKEKEPTVRCIWRVGNTERGGRFVEIGETASEAA